jgi:uncharacterized membrane protein
MVCFGVGDVIYKRAAAAGIGTGAFLVLQAWIFCPSVTLYAWLAGALPPHLSALWGSLAGLFLFIALSNFAQSLRGGAVSTNAPIFRLNFIITAVLAMVFLGETLTAAKAVALGCALVAVWLLLGEAAGPESGNAGDNTGSKTSWASLSRVLLATATMALTNLFYKVGLQQGALPETMVAAQAWVFCSLATISAWLGDNGLRVPARALPYSAAAALALFGAFILLMYGLVRGPASVLVPVAQMSFIITALVGIVAFRERLDIRKGAGIAVAAVALLLLAIG